MSIWLHIYKSVLFIVFIIGMFIFGIIGRISDEAYRICENVLSYAVNLE